MLIGGFPFLRTKWRSPLKEGSNVQGLGLKRELPLLKTPNKVSCTFPPGSTFGSCHPQQEILHHLVYLLPLTGSSFLLDPKWCKISSIHRMTTFACTGKALNCRMELYESEGLGVLRVNCTGTPRRSAGLEISGRSWRLSCCGETPQQNPFGVLCYLRVYGSASIDPYHAGTTCGAWTVHCLIRAKMATRFHGNSTC